MAQDSGPGRLLRVGPGSVGIDPAAILAFLRAVEQKVGGLHSLMLLRHGQVAAEGWWAPYGPGYPHQLYSLSKSFTSTAVGLALAARLLTVDAPVISFFPDDLPPRLDDNLKKMQVRHLLSMATGHDQDATGPTTTPPDGNWPRAFLALPVRHEPGTHFLYNSAATYMLSAIVQKLTGSTILEYLKPRLLLPIGIRDVTWQTDPRGVNIGAWGLSVRTEDIARFGQLYLQRGAWNGAQLLPESWVAEATRSHVANGTDPASDWNQGYCYQFWRCRHGAFRADGAFGQFSVVMPEQDAVLAITGGLNDMQAVLNAAWDHLLPAMKAGAITAGGQADALSRKLGALEVRPPQGHPGSPTAARVNGRTYRLDANDEKLLTATPTFRGSRCTVALQTTTGDRTLVSDTDAWIRATAPLAGPPLLVGKTDAPSAARGAWTDDDTYVMKICFYETPYEETITWKFSGDRVAVARKLNVGFGPSDLPALVGQAP